MPVIRFSSSDHWGYDSLGLLQLSVSFTGSRVLSALRDRDAYGRLYQLTYGSPSTEFRIRPGYTSTGYLNELRLPGTAWRRAKLIWAADAMSPHGDVTAERFGNGLLAKRSFDYEGLLKFIETRSAAAPIQQLAYDYDLAGELRSQHDVLAKITEDLEYDHLRRLKRWTTFQNCSRSVTEYTYDDIGNLLSMTAAEGPDLTILNDYAAGTGGPHAVKRTSSGGTLTTFSYDGAGRQLSSSMRTIEYKPFGLPKRIANPSRWTEFKYDAFQRRTTRTSSDGSHSVHLDDDYEVRTTGGVTSHIFQIRTDGRSVAQVTWVEQPNGAVSEDILYLHTDRLGSVDTITDGLGQVVEKRKFTPFGTRRSSSAVTTPVPPGASRARLGFTAHDLDDEFGLINMKGRIYDPSNGRFLTPDPFVHRPADGQSFNRYSYVLNRPYSFTDPTGFEETGVSRNEGGGSGSGWLTFEFDLFNTLDALRGIWRSLKEKASTAGHGGKQGDVSSEDEGRKPEPLERGIVGPLVEAHLSEKLRTAAIGAAGFVAGVIQGAVPLGWAFQPPPGMLPLEFEVPRGFGLMASGIYEMTTGGGAALGGGALTATGAGAPVGVPVAAVGAVVFAEGMADVGAGAYVLMAHIAAMNSAGNSPAQGGGTPAANGAGNSGGSGRGANNLKPDPNAQDSHTTFKTDPQGRVTGHAEWQPNPQNPSGFDQVKRVDTQYANPHTHHNKATGQPVPTPHVHSKSAPGGVRPARSDELPR